MPYLCRCFLAVLVGVIMASAARAEVPDLDPGKLQALASHIFNGKLARIYTTVVRSSDWATTYSVAELQIAGVEKGMYAGKLVYVRFWRKRYKGKGEAPDGAYGHRHIPPVGSTLRVFVKSGDDGGFDVINPNGFELISPAPEKSNETEKKTSGSG